MRLTADIDNNGRPVGLRSRDWGTPDWTWLEAFWFIHEDPTVPRFAVGRTVEHTFKKTGTYLITAWTCNDQGQPARTRLNLTVKDEPKANRFEIVANSVS